MAAIARAYGAGPPYADPDHPHNGPEWRSGRPCAGCGTRPAGTWWGPDLCQPCNAERLQAVADGRSRPVIPKPRGLRKARSAGPHGPGFVLTVLDEEAAVPAEAWDGLGRLPQDGPLARVVARIKGRSEVHDCTGWVAVEAARTAETDFDARFGHLADHWLEHRPPGAGRGPTADTVSDEVP